MSATPRFTPEDFKSPTWVRLRELMNARLQEHREQNDFGDPESTARRRGQIAELKELLALEPKAPRQAMKPASPVDAVDSLFD